MGRQISVNRPDAKVRGIPRRLRAVDRWADGFKDCVLTPADQPASFKLPVLDRLVRPPTVTDEIYARVISALIRAAHYLNSSVNSAGTGYARGAALIFLDDMFSSRANVFRDKAHYQKYWYNGKIEPNGGPYGKHWQSETLLPEGAGPSKRFGLTLPDGFVEVGAVIEQEEDWMKGLRSLKKNAGPSGLHPETLHL